MEQPASSPALRAATLARRLAARHCPAAPRGGTTCSWYHGLWPALRATGIVTSPADHAAFYTAALTPPQALPRVLVSGSADHALPAVLMGLYAQHRADLDLTVLDRCRTPLLMSHWYARQQRKPLHTVCGDILGHRAARPYDAICTHAFLGYFAPAQRPLLFQRWAALLRPGGRLALVNRIRPAAAPAVTRFEDGQAQRFVNEAGEQIAALGLDPRAYRAALHAYTVNKTNYPVRSIDELCALADAAGFTVCSVTLDSVPGKGARTAGGPTTAGGARYAQLLLLRRG